MPNSFYRDPREEMATLRLPIHKMLLIYRVLIRIGKEEESHLAFYGARNPFFELGNDVMKACSDINFKFPEIPMEETASKNM